jgi:hypothetical protein
MVHFVQIPVIALIEAPGPEEALGKAARILRLRRLQIAPGGSCVPVEAGIETYGAVLLEEKCRVFWRPGLVAAPGAPTVPTRCKHDAGHEGDHSFLTKGERDDLACGGQR